MQACVDEGQQATWGLSRVEEKQGEAGELSTPAVSALSAC